MPKGFFTRAIKDDMANTFGEEQHELPKPSKENTTSPKSTPGPSWLSVMIVDHRRGSMGFSGAHSPMDDDNRFVSEFKLFLSVVSNLNLSLCTG